MTADGNLPDVERCVEAATDCACLNFRKASRVVTQIYDAALEPAGLRATQFSLLVATHLASHATISRIAADLGMDRTTLTRNLKPLSRAGLLEVARGGDRRTRQVALTGGGRAALTKALPLWQKAQSQVVEELGADRWSRLLPELTTVISELRKA